MKYAIRAVFNTLTSPREAGRTFLKTFNHSISEQLTNIKTEQQRETIMADLWAAMDKAAGDNLQLKEFPKKRASCPPELLHFIGARFQATKNYDYGGNPLLKA